jgi:hyperosmotically inducible periplasmic protein
MRSAIVFTLAIGLPAFGCSSHGRQDSPSRISGAEARTVHEAPVTRAESTRHDADNTARNARDREDKTLTPLDQSEKASDLEVTQRIRKSLVRDKSLSTNAKNVKIITVDGAVTLRGPVKSEKERAKIVANAKRIAGAGKVADQLEIEAKR